ncbi:MAG: type II toxin-antitoxin system VapC family toxin [Acidobacteria bacterium]|nr:type II toxin-antitoxin system VapC family toxin [Acidobacteriota bacterium]
MKALLDTHVFLWWTLDDPRLPKRVRRFVQDPANALVFSVASAWELAIKAQLRKLTLPDRVEQFIQEQLDLNAILPLPVQLEHALQVAELPAHHRDPFDRLLIAQSLVERLPMITGDPFIARYQVETIW